MGDNSPHSGRRKYLKAIGVGLAAGIAGCTGGDGGDGGDGGNGGGTTTQNNTVDEVVIGLNHPLTGSLSFAGQQISQMGDVAAKHINDEGGIESLGGAEIRIIKGDNQAAQEQGSQVEQELIDEGAHICMGCYSSPVSLAAIQVAEREQVPHIMDVSISPAILQDNDFDYGYRAQATPLGFSRDFARYGPSIARDNGKTWDTMSILSIDNLFGDSVRDGIKQFITEEDVEIVLEDNYQLGAESFSSQATQVKNTDPDAVFFVGYDPGAIGFAQALQDVDYQPNLMVGSGTPFVSASSVFEEVGPFMNGTMGNNSNFNYNADLTQTILDDYEEMHGEPVQVKTIGNNYMTMMVARKALENAGTVNGPELNEAIQNVELSESEHPMAQGDIAFRDDGENRYAMEDPEYVSTAFMQVQDQEAATVAPEQYATGEPQF
jgi:branched-chain amino acid transport system substrate-binding protein